MDAFATTQDVITFSGRAYTAAEQERITALLPVLSDVLRTEASKVGKDLDGMVASDRAYANTVRLVLADIAIRVVRQSLEGDPMTQETQSGLGYSWSGSYAVPGGGIAAAIMKNDLKRLGLKRQRYGMEDFYGMEDQGTDGPTP